MPAQGAALVCSRSMGARPLACRTAAVHGACRAWLQGAPAGLHGPLPAPGPRALTLPPGFPAPPCTVRDASWAAGEVGATSVASLDWSDPSCYSHFTPPYDYILAADCVYSELAGVVACVALGCGGPSHSAGQPSEPCALPRWRCHPAARPPWPCPALPAVPHLLATVLAMGGPRTQTIVTNEFRSQACAWGIVCVCGATTLSSGNGVYRAAAEARAACQAYRCFPAGGGVPPAHCMLEGHGWAGTALACRQAHRLRSLRFFTLYRPFMRSS